MINPSRRREPDEKTIGIAISEFFEYSGYGKKGFVLLKELGRVSSVSGFRIYLVGGFIRDIIINILSSGGRRGNIFGPASARPVIRYPEHLSCRHETLDIDLALEGDIRKFIGSLSEVKGFTPGKIECHQAFGTASVEFAVNKLPLKIDIATARTEFYKAFGALPTVDFKNASLEKDVRRRDFTVNSIAASINPSDFLSLKDYLDGLTDIKNKKIRVIHKNSFKDDPTRIFRAVRFEKRLGFEIENETLSLIQEALNGNFMGNISGKRIANEIDLLLKEKKPWIFMERLQELGILKSIHSGLRFTGKNKEVFKNICAFFSSGDSRGFYGKKAACADLSPLKYLYGGTLAADFFLAEIFRALIVAEAEKLMENLNMSRKTKIAVIKMYSDYEILEKFKKEGVFRIETKDTAIVEKLEQVGDKSLLFFLFRQNPCNSASLILAKTIVKYLSRLVFVKPEVNGADLESIGISRGVSCGKIFRELRFLKLEGKLNNKKDELEYLKKRFSS